MTAIDAAGPVDEVCVPGDVVLPPQAPRHRAPEAMVGIVERGQPRIADASSRVGRRRERVGVHDSDERPRHAEVAWAVEEPLQRLTGTPDAQRSAGRLDGNDADVVPLRVEPGP